MVELQREPEPEGPVIVGFTPRGFKLRDRVVEGGLWLTPRDIREWRAPRAADRLSADALDALLEIAPPPEFLLLGTGPELVRPPPAFAARIEERGIGLEVMASKTAARTWGVLRQEERWIVAALMPFA